MDYNFWQNYFKLIIWYGFSSEITMPINEATSGGLFQFPLQLFSFVYTLVLTELIQSTESKSGIFWSFIIFIGTTIFGTFIAILMKPPPMDRNETMRTEASKSFELAHIDEIEYCEKKWYKW